MNGDTGLVVSSALVVIVAALLFPFVRRRVVPRREPALVFLAPIPMVIAVAVYAVVTGDRAIVAVPIASVAILHALTAAAFWPTRNSRFQSFERSFWEYVERHPHLHLHDRRDR